MKILFIGGTGRLSSDVAKKSVDAGYEVYLITRGTPQRKKFIDKRFKMIYSNIKNEYESKEKLKNLKFDVIIDFLSYNLNDLKKTLNIIENCYKQYIFISSATVYNKKSEKEIIKENSTEVGNNKWQYAYKKYECEKYLNEYFKNKKENYTIIRPYVTYNKTRIPYPLAPGNPTQEYSIIKRIKENKSLVIFNKGKTLTTITNTKDFAKGVVGLYMNNKAYNTAFHITSDEKVTWGEVIKYIGEYYDKKPNLINLEIKDIIKKYPFYEQILNGDKAYEMIFDCSKIKNTVKNFECEINLKKGIYEVLDFYEKNPEFQIVDYLWYGRMDNICKSKKEKKIISLKNKIYYFIGYYTILYKLLILAKKIKGAIRKWKKD